MRGRHLYLHWPGDYYNQYDIVKEYTYVATVTPMATGTEAAETTRTACGTTFEMACGKVNEQTLY